VTTKLAAEPLHISLGSDEVVAEVLPAIRKAQAIKDLQEKGRHCGDGW